MRLLQLMLAKLIWIVIIVTLEDKAMQINKDEILYTRLEAADYLGVAYTTLRTWACRKKGALPYRKVGARVQYTKTDLDNYIKSRIR